ncbi:prenyltransferase/squalene oxidase repeat-containing protein [Nocardioides massiliensis]|uniref:Terpene cyclase/mutase family protein n=1 Tax=Nocardioides massiliensis TaxID=1325935 RepID=A0ABT9NTL4_9ACTN|nr:prenyltransferase/squalene oxidase repeat-containing protein [Nocardioides massiliensis]MDP9823765.1 hypothetical protein [Nocardioides massiliensis]
MSHRPQSRRTSVRRAGVAAVAASVALTGALAGGVVAPASAAPLTAPASADPRPANAAAGWLASELGADGLLTYDSGFGDFRDVGLSIDAGLALAAAGGRTGAVSSILGGLEDALGSYIAYEDTRYAGSTAKAAAFVLETGNDPATFSADVDLVERLESHVLTDEPVAGRLADHFDPDSEFGADYANTIGQTFATRVLTTAGSDLADEVTGFLLDQQCEAGYFRLYFADQDAAGQTCDDAPPAGTPTADTTALAVIQLSAIEQPSDEVSEAIDDAVAWMLTQQQTGGGFLDNDTLNANTTGLAGWALAVAGEDAAAARAAGVLRALQGATIAPCIDALETDRGAVALDPAALAAGRKDGVTTATRGQWLRATAQAVPALAWAPAGGTAAVKAPEWARAGKQVAVRASGFAPGETVCVQVGANERQVTATVGGVVRASVPVQAKPARRVVRVVGDSGEQAQTRVKAIKAKKLRVQVAKRPLRAGAVQRIVVRGLAAGEPVRIFVRGKRIAAGTAGPKGAFQKRVRITKAGPARVRVVGQFPQLRKGAAAFRVVR